MDGNIDKRDWEYGENRIFDRNSNQNQLQDKIIFTKSTIDFTSDSPISIQIGNHQIPEHDGLFFLEKLPPNTSSNPLVLSARREQIIADCLHFLFNVFSLLFQQSEDVFAGASLEQLGDVHLGSIQNQEGVAHIINWGPCRPSWDSLLVWCHR